MSDDKMLTEDDLWDALDGLYAYDKGCLDSGIRNEGLRAQVQRQMRAMPEDGKRVFLVRRAREQYRTLGDVIDFWRWLDEEMGCAI